MRVTLLKAKLHRATVTDANLAYEGSITIDRALTDAARLSPFERVDVYNITNGERFTTYVILGGRGEICVNGAAARKVQRGDKIIVAAYAEFDENEAIAHRPIILLLDDDNAPARSPTPA